MAALLVSETAGSGVGLGETVAALEAQVAPCPVLGVPRGGGEAAFARVAEWWLGGVSRRGGIVSCGTGQACPAARDKTGVRKDACPAPQDIPDTGMSRPVRRDAGAGAAWTRP